MKYSLCFVVLSVTLLLSGLLFAADNTEQKSAEWFVISADKIQLLQQAFPLGQKIGNKSKIENLSVEKDKIKLCLTPNDKCVFLIHPEKQSSNSLTFGSGSENLTMDEKQTIESAISKVPMIIWKQATREDQSLFGLEGGWSNAIWYMLQNNAISNADKLVESLEKYAKDEIGIKLFKVIVLLLDNKQQDARMIMKELKDKEADSQLILMTEGIFDSFDNKTQQGAEKINRSLNDLPEGSYNRCHTANLVPLIMAKNGRQQQAIDTWKSLESTMPDCNLILISHAGELLQWGKNDQALELIEKSLQNDPKNIDKLLTKANILRRLKRIPEALEIVSQINDVKPNDPSMISLHSTMASTMNHIDDYLAKMLERVKKNDKDLFAKHAAAVMSYYHGDFARAQKLSAEVLKEMPNNSRARIYNSMSKYQQGDWEGALKGIQTLEEMGTDDPDLYYCYAMIWSGKDTDKARIYLEQYLAHPVSPDSVPEKQQRAWKEWEGLKKGIPPKAWQPGEEYPTKLGNNINQPVNENHSNTPFIVVLLILVALGFTSGLVIGRKK